MLNCQPVSHGLLAFSVLFRRDLHSESTLTELIEDSYGDSTQLSPTYNPLLQYYAKEMGDETLLGRKIYCCLTPFPREFLLSTKLLSIDWERTFSSDNRRTINIDVGFLSLENFILATTKNFSHRIFLGQGIFADLSYQFVHGKFSPLPWCYPDYQHPEKIEFFTWCREILLQKLSLRQDV